MKDAIPGESCFICRKYFSCSTIRRAVLDANEKHPGNGPEAQASRGTAYRQCFRNCNERDLL